MARRGVGSETASAARKRKSGAADGDPLTLDARPYAPRPRKVAAKSRIRRPGRIAAAVAVTLAVGGAVTVGVVQAMNARGHHARPPVSQAPFSVARNAAPAAATPVVAAIEARPLTDYQPPDREQVSSAFLKVGATYRSEGLSGVVRQSMDCFSGLKSAPSYATLDFCIAADAFGEALQRKLTSDQPPASDSYFADAASRELNAARAVVGADGDAGARVLDIHHLAGEVSQAGSGAATALVAENDRTPPAIATLREDAPDAAPVEAPPPSAKSFVKPARAVVRAPVAHAIIAPPVRATTRKAPTLHATLPAPRLQTASTPARESHPKLVKTHARAEPTVERPRLTRVSAPVKRTHAPTRFAADDARDDPHKPPRQRLAAASAPHVIRHPARDEEAAAASPPWTGALRAIRASLTARDDVAARRASEPAEWVDCRRPRKPAEIRLCEAPSGGGDGTLQGQVRSGRNR